MPSWTNEPASGVTANQNVAQIQSEKGSPLPMTRQGFQQGIDITRNLRSELASKGLPGFRKGGKVKKTGVYKLHKGERVLTKRQARARHSRGNITDA